jgi:hypothetical protein
MAVNEVVRITRFEQALRRDIRRTEDRPVESCSLPARGNSQDEVNDRVDLEGALATQLTPEEQWLVMERAAMRSWSELAEAYGCTVDALRMRHARLLEALREHFLEQAKR